MIGHADATVTATLMLSLAAATAVYLACWWRRADHLGRVVWWCAGVGAIVVAALGPVPRLAERSFTGHMVQHLLILCVAAPALVLARPLLVVGARVRWPRLQRNSRWRAVSAAAPIVGPLAAVIILYVIHLTPVYEQAMRSAVVHEIEHAGFLLAGCALWGAVLAARLRRAPWRIATTFGATAATALLGMILTTGSAPISATYVARSGLDSALDDQRLGASLMWVGGMALTLPLLMVAVWRWASAEQRAVERSESLAAGSVAANSWR